MCLKYLQDNLNVILALIILIILVHVYLVKKEKFQNDKEFVMYHTTWCGYSKRAKKEFDKLGSTYNGITIRDIDCDINKQKCSSENIRGYPTFKLHETTMQPIMYNGDRTISGFKQFLDRN